MTVELKATRPVLNVVDDSRLTVHEYVRETLRKAILRGDLKGGERLIQADLATQLEVSTTPVREALRDLATEGLITLDRHRGGVVRELNWDEMDEIRRIQVQLQPMRVALLIEGVTPETLARAEALCDRMEAEEDPGTWVELNQRFHVLFHEATRSPRLASILKGLDESASIYVAQAQRWHPELRRRANAEHRELVEAYRSRDAAKALEILPGHIAMSIEMTDPIERGSTTS